MQTPELTSLLLVLAGLLVLNAIMAASLWVHQRTPLHRALLLLWACSIFSLTLQGLVQTDPGMIFAFGAGSFPVTLALVELVQRALKLRARWRAYLVGYSVGTAATLVAVRAGAPFWVRALPTAIAVAWPLLDQLLQGLRLPRRSLSITGRAVLISTALLGLHLLDYPILRDDPRSATLGFIIAILSVFALSTTAPAVILEAATLEHRQMRAEVQRLNEQLELRIHETLAAVRARDELLSTASHELRTPLTSLKLQVKLARQSGVRLDERLRTMDRQVTRLEVLVNQLLDLSRITSHRLQLDRAETDLTEVVREVVAQLAPQGAQVDSPIQVEAAEAVRGDWDGPRLEQVFTNLLSNAIKFGAGRPIEVRVREMGDEAAVVVTDHGIGISPEDQSRIFLPFERATSPRHYGGLGLGLWISARIVEAHGGSISVKSRPGEGAAFSVVLPKQPHAHLPAPPLKRPVVRS